MGGLCLGKVQAILEDVHYHLGIDPTFRALSGFAWMEMGVVRTDEHMAGGHLDEHCGGLTGAPCGALNDWGRVSCGREREGEE